MATAAAGCRFSLGMTFSSEAEKDAFKLRVDSARRILFPYESTSQRPDNAALLNAMLDIVLSIQSTTPSTTQSTHSFLDTAGICTGDENKDDQRLCVVEHKAIRCLCQGLVQQHCGRPRPTWQLESFMKKGGIVQIRFVCPHCKVARTWASSRVLAGNYLASQKQVAMLMYCTTSSTKNVAKEMKKICAGPVKARDKTWFAQLSDKARSTKVHLYWCMKNCASNPA
eukprot:Em0014g968a